jgi:hypothetical protein
MAEIKNSEPIEIIIKGSPGGATGSGQAGVQEKDPTDDKKKKVKQGLQWDLRSESINLALKNQAMSFMSTAVSQYGNITGDYSTGKNITALTNLLGYAADIAIGHIGWINLTGKLATQSFMFLIQQQKEKYEIDRALDRYGTIYNSGGRGTSE